MQRSIRLIVAIMAATLASAPAFAADAGDSPGKKAWDKACGGCHAMMAPKFGDKAAWAPFVKLGVEPVTASVLKGKGMIPPKGGAKTDEEVRAAVEYALDQMK